MKVTNITPQVHRPNRYSIYVDGRYAFSLSADALLSSKLATGQELDASQLQTLKTLSAEDKSYNSVLAYLARRPRSEWEILAYMRRKRYDGQSQHDILEKLHRLGLVDDVAFARSWVENRRLLKPVSKRRLEQELKQKRVGDQTIEEVLAEDDTNDLDTLRQLVEQKRRQSRYQDNQKLMQYLARQGYRYEDIKTVLDNESE